MRYAIEYAVIRAVVIIALFMLALEVSGTEYHAPTQNLEISHG